MNYTTSKMYGLIFLFLMSCRPAEEYMPPPLSAPQLVIFGEDISGTFKQHERLAPDELSRFCYDLMKENIPVSIFIGPIGNPNYKPFLKCDLVKVPEVDHKATLSTRKTQTLEQNRIVALNEAAIQNFIASYISQIYDKPVEQNTDIAGFFEKTRQVIIEPQYASYQKTLFLHSDGFQDIKGDKKIDPLSSDIFGEIAFFVSGLKNETLVKNLDVVFLESQRAFVDNFPLTIKNN